MPTSMVIKRHLSLWDVLIEDFLWTTNKVKCFEKWQVVKFYGNRMNQPTVIQCDVFLSIFGGVR